MTYQVTITFSDIEAITSLNKDIFSGATTKVTKDQDVILEAGNMDPKLFNDICQILSNSHYDGSRNNILQEHPEDFVKLVSEEIAPNITLSEGVTEQELDFLTLRMRELGWESLSSAAIMRELSRIWKTMVPDVAKATRNGFTHMWKEIKEYTESPTESKYVLEVHDDGKVLTQALHPEDLEGIESVSTGDVKVLLVDSDHSVFYLPKEGASKEEYLDNCSKILSFINHKSFTPKLFRFMSKSLEKFIAEGFKTKVRWERQVQ